MPPTPRGSALRAIDFANFRYPAKPVFPKGDKSFALKNGAFEGWKDQSVGLAFLDFGDVTGDGNEEVIVVLTMSTRGSAIPYFLYVYTLDQGRTRLLWSFAAGDRADGGLRKAEAAGGQLLVELYGKGKTIGTDLYAEDDMAGGDCCPTHFTRATYSWQAGAFHKLTEETLPNPDGAALVIMPR
jgi:hypothetical protein